MECCVQYLRTIESGQVKPYLNLGCGRIHLPGERPMHHQFVPLDIYTEHEWVNIDRSPNVGADKVFDLFTYPWPLESDAYDGALLSHLVEHISHEIKLAPFEYADGLPATHAPYKDVDLILEMGQRRVQLECLQDGWYAFFAELYRVLKHGAIAHILSPYAWSQGAITDPTHTRFITEHTFTHQLSKADQNSAFQYVMDCNFEVVENPRFHVTEMFGHLVSQPDDNEETAQRKRALFQETLMTRLNVVYDIYVQLKAVKE